MQVYVHFSILDAENDLLYTTWAEEGGSGQTLAFVVGKGCRAPRAWELAVLGECRSSRMLTKPVESCSTLLAASAENLSLSIVTELAVNPCQAGRWQLTQQLFHLSAGTAAHGLSCHLL